MDTTVAVAPIGFLSHDGTSTIKGSCGSPSARGAAASVAPRGVHSDRPRHGGACGPLTRVRRRFLVEQGFVVLRRRSHRHGKSVASADELGCLPVDGRRRSSRTSTSCARPSPPRTPPKTLYIMVRPFHGSFVTRAYLARHGEDVAAAVIMRHGPTAPRPVEGGQTRWRASSRRRRAPTTAASFWTAWAWARSQADREPAHAARLGLHRSGRRGRPTSRRAVRRHVLRRRLRHAHHLTGEVVSPSCAAKVPKGLPVLFVAGAEDPVGACGKGVRAAADCCAAPVCRMWR